MTMYSESSDPDPRRRPRSVMASDSEWERIRERASASGMSISSFICLRTTGPERKRPPGPTPQAIAARLERTETAVLTLAEVERRRLAERGEAEEWETVLRKVSFRLRTGWPDSGDPEEGESP